MRTARRPSGGAYTILAVWRVTTEDGHPFPVRPESAFTATARNRTHVWCGDPDRKWTETIDTLTQRALPPLGSRSDATVVAYWTRRPGSLRTVRVFWRCGDTVTFGARTVDSVRVWSGKQAAENWFVGAAPCVGPGPALGELLIWDVDLSDSDWTVLNARYLTARWGQGSRCAGVSAPIVPGRTRRERFESTEPCWRHNGAADRHRCDARTHRRASRRFSRAGVLVDGGGAGYVVHRCVGDRSGHAR